MQAKDASASPRPADALASFPLDLEEMMSSRSMSGPLGSALTPPASEEGSPKGARPPAGMPRQMPPMMRSQ